MNTGHTRLVAVVSLVLGVTVALLAEMRVPWPKFLESEARRIAWGKEFPDRDPNYRSTSETPKWEDGVDLQNYERELQKLVTAPPSERVGLKAKYHAQQGALPFAFTVGIAWLVYGAAIWIRKGFKTTSQQRRGG